MTNHNFKMGTFSFRFLENFCQLQRRQVVEPKQINDTCRRRVIFLVFLIAIQRSPIAARNRDFIITVNRHSKHITPSLQSTNLIIVASVTRDLGSRA